MFKLKRTITWRSHPTWNFVPSNLRALIRACTVAIVEREGKCNLAYDCWPQVCSCQIEIKGMEWFKVICVKLGCLDQKCFKFRLIHLFVIPSTTGVKSAAFFWWLTVAYFMRYSTRGFAIYFVASIKVSYYVSTTLPQLKTRLRWGRQIITHIYTI